MLTRVTPGWQIPESRATDESVYWRRREILKAMGVGTTSLAIGAAVPRRLRAQDTGALAGELYPPTRNDSFQLDRELTDEDLATTYNNFYEFGSHKQISAAAQSLQIRPWEVVIDGLVEAEVRLDAEDLIRRMQLEERLYRHRCVEAWSMAVPWSGFPMTALIDFAKPLGSAKYVRMETFEDPSMASGQRQFWYPWPYVEGLTMAEATNELAFIGTGLYGKPMPKQNGSPLRLVVPWKYGFKSIKSVVRFSFVEERPLSFWEEIQASEYGFWANVNPDVPHPRWSQATEKMLGSNDKVPTLLYNGYGEQVAHLYADLQDEPLFM